ncbi:protein DpdF [Paracoccaceae bacterium]|nr:protein DpdF [Paracoccaceae bacterium]
MDLLSWIKTKDEKSDIEFDTDVGVRLEQIVKSTDDKSLLFCNSDFVSLLTQYVRIKSLELKTASDLLISEKFQVKDFKFLENFGVRFGYTANGVIHCNLSPITPNWLSDNEIFNDVLSYKNVRPDWSVVIDPITYSKVKYSNYKSLGQRSMLRAAERLDPGDTLFSVLPTSGGKSLLTHTAFMKHRFSGGLTVCVVPTIALALDQERQFIEVCKKNKIDFGHRCFAWRAGLTEVVKNEIKKSISNGTQGVVFCSPEALVSSLLPSMMRSAKNGFLKNFIIDEAHLIVQWGDEFRPAFQTLSGLRKGLLENCPSDKKFFTHLLTATLSVTAFDVLKMLFKGEKQTHLVNARLLRQEPTYHFKKFNSKEEKYEKFSELIFNLPRPSIIYTTEKTHSYELHRLIEASGFKRIACFTGDTPDGERQKILSKWRNDELDLIVATSAFGVGIDKNNVRSVVHVGLPETLDRYYQEVGRGGRDGKASISILLFDDDDKSTAFSMAVPSYLTEENAYERWQTMIEAAQPSGIGSYLLDTRLVPKQLRQNSDYNRNWNVLTLTMMARAKLIQLSSFEPSVPGLNSIDLLDELDTTNDDLWESFFSTQKIKLLDPQLNDQIHFNQAIDNSRTYSTNMHQRQYKLFETYLDLKEDLGDCLARLYSYSAVGMASDVLPTCRGCEFCNGSQFRVNAYQHVAPRISFAEYEIDMGMNGVLDLNKDPIIHSPEGFNSKKISDLFDGLARVSPLFEVVAHSDWIEKVFWPEIYPKLRNKNLFLTDLEDIIEYQQVVNVPLVFVCTSEISNKNFKEIFTLDRDVAFFIVLNNRQDPFSEYRDFVENSENKLEYSNFMMRLNR